MNHDKASQLAFRLAQLRSGGRVERCHAIPHIGSYSNAAHTWGVMALFYLLWPQDFPRVAAVLMFHDVPEAWVGDVPAPMMRYFPDVREAFSKVERRILSELDLPWEHDLSPSDHEKFKACDRLELYAWCKDQLRLGNHEVEECLHELEVYFTKTPLPEPADVLLGIMRSGTLEARQAGVVRHASEQIAAEGQDAAA